MDSYSIRVIYPDSIVEERLVSTSDRAELWKHVSEAAHRPRSYKAGVRIRVHDLDGGILIAVGAMTARELLRAA